MSGNRLYRNTDVFRIFGFQRKFVLKNFRLANDIEKWKHFARLLNRDNPPKNALEITDIGYKRRGKLYIVKVKHGGIYFKLHFRRNSMIVTSADGGIYIPWQNFNREVLDNVFEKVRKVAKIGLDAYNYIFNQKACIIEEEWIVKPKVSFIDSVGILKSVRKVLGCIRVDVFNATVIGSGELCFDSIEDALLFKEIVKMSAMLSDLLRKYVPLFIWN